MAFSKQDLHCIKCHQMSSNSQERFIKYHWIPKIDLFNTIEFAKCIFARQCHASNTLSTLIKVDTNHLIILCRILQLVPQSHIKMIKSNHHWCKSDDAKLRELINQGKINPKDISLAAIKAIHDHWKHKPFNTSAELICKNRKKIRSG